MKRAAFDGFDTRPVGGMTDVVFDPFDSRPVPRRAA